MYVILLFCFFKQKTAYEMRISDGSSDVCSSDLQNRAWSGMDARIKSGRDEKGTTGMNRDEGGPRRRKQQNATPTAADALATNCHSNDLPKGVDDRRTAERRVGKECVSKLTSRW